MLESIDIKSTLDIALKFHPETREVAVITDMARTGPATEILNRGCNGFIQKPFNLKSFSQKVREVLDM